MEEKYAMEEKYGEEKNCLEEEALDCLLEICRHGDKPGDRIAAAKLLLEHSRKNEDWDRTLTVVMEGVNQEYLR